MTAINDPFTVDVDEQTSGQYKGTLVGNDGVTPIPAASLISLTLSLYVIKSDGTQAVINGRNVQNVLNLNNVTVDGNGLLTWNYQSADTTLVETPAFERHVAVFAWATATAVGRKEVVLVVRHLTRAA